MVAHSTHNPQSRPNSNIPPSIELLPDCRHSIKQLWYLSELESLGLAARDLHAFGRKGYERSKAPTTSNSVVRVWLVFRFPPERIRQCSAEAGTASGFGSSR